MQIIRWVLTRAFAHFYSSRATNDLTVSLTLEIRVFIECTHMPFVCVQIRANTFHPQKIVQRSDSIEYSIGPGDSMVCIVEKMIARKTSFAARGIPALIHSPILPIFFIVPTNSQACIYRRSPVL